MSDDDDGYAFVPDARGGGDDDEPTTYDAGTQDEYEAERINLDEAFEPVDSSVMRLKRAWVSERLCPEMLEYQGELLEDVRERVAAQCKALEERERERAERGSSGAEDASEKMMDDIMWIEVNRVKYLMREYLRTRLHKIEEYSLHVLTDEDTSRRLSEKELEYAEGYVKAVDVHFGDALRELPQQYRQFLKEFDDDEREVIPKPDLDAFVIFRVREDVPNFQVDDGESVTLRRGEIILARYSRFKPLTETDPPQAELV